MFHNDCITLPTCARCSGLVNKDSGLQRSAHVDISWIRDDPDPITDNSLTSSAIIEQTTSSKSGISFVNSIIERFINNTSAFARLLWFWCVFFTTNVSLSKRQISKRLQPEHHVDRPIIWLHSCILSPCIPPKSAFPIQKRVLCQQTLLVKQWMIVIQVHHYEIELSRLMQLIGWIAMWRIKKFSISAENVDDAKAL